LATNQEDGVVEIDNNILFLYFSSYLAVSFSLFLSLSLFLVVCLRHLVVSILLRTVGRRTRFTRVQYGFLLQNGFGRAYKYQVRAEAETPSAVVPKSRSRSGSSTSRPEARASPPTIDDVTQRSCCVTPNHASASEDFRSRL
jgi:hypothetical protein